MTESRLPVVAAIISNWNGGSDSIRAIHSLAASAYAPLRIIVVDNGSATDDLASIKAQVSDVVFVELAENHGFGRAVNIGAATAFRLGAEHLLLFNNDAAIPTGVPVIEGLVSELARSETIGAVGPIIVDSDERHTVQAAGFFLRPCFPIPQAVAKGTPYDIVRTQSHRFGYLQGSCLLVRGTAYVAVNGFDPDFFFLAEDADLMLRLKTAGYRASLVRDAYVVHRKSSSIKAGSDNYIYASLRSNLIFLKKHARWYEVPSAALTMLAISIALCALSFATRRKFGLASVVRAWSDFFAGRWGGHGGTWATGYVPLDFKAIWDERPDRNSAVRFPEC
jgi:N-acetylglucosaminyl-diphospho-decaprenol L-rhamnosyltransferase